MIVTNHKKWVINYIKKNYGCTPVIASNIIIDKLCNFIIESWDSRLNIWKDQVPFMKKDNFCVLAELGSDRDGSYCHYKFVFPFEYVDNKVNKDKNMTDIEELKYAISQRDRLIKQMADALSWYADKPLPCTNKGKFCGSCTEFDMCSYRRNRLLIDKAKAIVK